MVRKPKILFEVKVAAVKDYLNGEKSVTKISDELSVNPSTVAMWIRLYNARGEAGLLTKRKNTSYPKELKIEAVEEYLAGNGSLRDISLKYGLCSKRQLQNWIIKYNSHEEIKSSGSGGNQIMTKGRVTTLDERITIVEYCIENNKNYTVTGRKYEVSYQQVRNWVLKFEELGVDGLIDCRGKRKSKDQLSEIEKLKTEMKLLEAKNKRLEMENELLKKLEETEGWRY
ncbi:transposase-like protein [Clostridium tetanomorphum]|uniref:Helix-turn-helix domain-containing protein n=1 Tax=Clostridium tetanomorphum TaxID=1553 RepID=A0A923E530_CLOTT|nr:helix-turn-helix domain-containing protein [Clostridium tetanomorphum]KAJ53411.1 transposase IS3/IS911 family protein [Clostridium tetanomorphum DSM 665]MBC2396602.1 helix-turn-helix domain-containing protein [Clostridium tetanomorphum]MBP1863932.1 transposase-like protein [Clostridium tetanomorphum]NRS85010.1 transposase-like protein [Clostridium tetanomorphum]NRZ98226.1 transposase-like protein [Clostridium tetanomorphum]